MMGKRILGLALCVWLMVGLTNSNTSGDLLDKLAPDLASLLNSTLDLTIRVPVIVQTFGPVTGDDLAVAYEHDGDVYDVFDSFPAYAAQFPLSQLQQLITNPRIKHISLDEAISGTMATAVPAINADAAWRDKGVSGNGVTVAVLDSGYQPHPDLKTSRVVAWKDFVGSSTKPFDDNGHGTHVTGIIAGDATTCITTGYRDRFYGVGPKARIISLKVLNSSGSGYVSTAMAGIDWCITNRAAYNIRVMNVSLGRPVRESYKYDPLCQALEAAWKSGIVVVVAAGNRGRSIDDNPDGPPTYMSIDSPGNDPYVITVGATNTCGTLSTSDDVMASYSSHGPTAIDHILKPDLVAPGNLTISLNSAVGYLYLNYPGNAIDPATYGSADKAKRYFRMSGTSMSSAVVAGAVALMLEKSPSLSPDTVKARLMASATKGVKNRDGSKASIFFQGSGLVNVRAALDYTNQAITKGSAWSPVTNRGLVPYLFQLDTNVLGGVLNLLWSSNTIWTAASKVYGGNALWADAGILGGSNALWADKPYDRRLYEQDSLWGSNALWADSSPNQRYSWMMNGDR